jgi:glucose/arabinose dehydrogenase
MTPTGRGLTTVVLVALLLGAGGGAAPLPGVDPLCAAPAAAQAGKGGCCHYNRGVAGTLPAVRVLEESSMSVRFVVALIVLALVASLLATDASEGSRTIVQGPAPQHVEDRFVPEPRGVRVSDWVTRLEVPWSLVFLPDGRALVSERIGRIRMIEDGQVLARPVAELDVAHPAEGGLRGLALHPRFPAEPFLYAMATTGVTGRLANQVVRLRLQGRRARLDRVIVDDIPAGERHHGGRLAFGRDGLLYITTGDTADMRLPQDRTSLAGKILRVTAEGKPAPGNPWGSPVFSLGHRNPQGLAWHPMTGDLFVSEHGPTGELGVVANDEINVIRRGANYGWPLVVGAPGQGGFTDPLIAWTRRPTPPSGMTFWRGDLYVATLGSEALIRIEIERRRDGYRVSAIERWFNDGRDPAGRYGRLRDAVVGPDDALYVLTNRLDGGGTPEAGDDRIIRIDRGL